jgi:hypothetical protein
MIDEKLAEQILVLQIIGEKKHYRKPKVVSTMQGRLGLREFRADRTTHRRSIMSVCLPASLK